MNTSTTNGFCICVHCQTEIPHLQGIPCRENDCPSCGKKMMRKGSYHHQLYLSKQGEKTMKVAVPTRGSVVDDHFGHCEMYTVFTIDQNKGIALKEIVPSPQGCGCKSNIAAVLREKGVDLLLAGNMGAGALNVLNRHDIEVVRGCKGDVEQLVTTFLKGELADSGVGCDHHHDHDGEHACNH